MTLHDHAKNSLISCGHESVLDSDPDIEIQSIISQCASLKGRNGDEAFQGQVDCAIPASVVVCDAQDAGLEHFLTDIACRRQIARLHCRHMRGMGARGGV